MLLLSFLVEQRFSVKVHYLRDALQVCNIVVYPPNLFYLVVHKPWCSHVSPYSVCLVVLFYWLQLICHFPSLFLLLPVESKCRKIKRVVKWKVSIVTKMSLANILRLHTICKQWLIQPSHTFTQGLLFHCITFKNLNSLQEVT